MSDTLPPSPASGGGNTFSRMALFLSLITMTAVAVLTFYAYLTQKNINALQNQSRDAQTSVQALLSEAKQSLAQMETWQQEAQAQQKAFHALKTDLQNAQMRLVTLNGNKNWVISEINYLILMANERLRIAHDIPTAIAQLQSAEEKVTMLGDPALWELKEALIKDIAKLSTLPRVNRQGLWEQLNALRLFGIEQLSFETLSNQAKSTHEIQMTTADPSLPAWRKGLWLSWQELKSLIRITKEVENPLPEVLFFQKKADILREMRFITYQAQWAVLEGNDKIYLDCLQSLEYEIDLHFASDRYREVVIELLTQLKAQPVSYPLADISATLKALSSIKNMEKP